MITIEQTKCTNMDAVFKELAVLRAENRNLRSMLDPNRRYSRTVQRAIVDAHTIVMAGFSGDSTGVATMQEQHGLTRRRWEWGVAVLRYAGIVATGSRQWRNGLEWLVVDLDESIKLLEKAGRELDSAPGYKRLRGVMLNATRK